MPRITTSDVTECFEQSMAYIQLNAPPQLLSKYLLLPRDAAAFVKFIRSEYRMKIGFDYHIYTVGNRVLVLRPRSTDSESWYHDFVETARFYRILTASHVVLIRGYPKGDLPSYVRSH
jgi:hypothetical protein